MTVVHDASIRQIEAADPRASTWLSANAGSGKTRVLTDRVARLLLDGVDPQNILCLTYTKAAASEMQNRLFKRLGKWAMMQDAELRSDLQQMGSEDSVSAEHLAQARTLFARAIETPGGLKIQTIHSFCSGILRRFPLEAGVSPQFAEMEDRDSEILRAEVLDQLSEGSQSHVIDGIARYLGDENLSSFVAEVYSQKQSLLRPNSHIELSAELGLAPDAVPENAIDIAWIGGEADLVKDLCEIVTEGKLAATYQKLAANLKAINHTKPTAEGLVKLAKLFLDSSGEPKIDRIPQRNHTKAVDAFEPISDDLNAWIERTFAAIVFLRSLEAHKKSKALHAFSAVYIPAYEQRKLELGVLDFDDLIDKARQLLTDPVVAQWVLFKLDGGIDHILVDEAQDTSPAQWSVIEALTQEFASGIGATPDRDRTIFVVGDKKQSIYSFQGADPEGFDRMREHFSNELGHVGKRLNSLALEFSFRSSSAILSLVDATFTGERAVGLENTVKHLAFKNAMPGRVDLWPAIEKSKDDTSRDWHDPVDLVSEEHHTVQLAKTIALNVRHMITHETIPTEADTNGAFARRKITEGDVLILVQSRGPLFQEIIRELKKAKLEVAGADRLKIGGELAVKDILALLRFLALPEDNLSLASALRSPLFGWSEKELYSVAQGRPAGQSLWEAMRPHRDRFPRTFEIIDDLLRRADFFRPYDLVSRILIRHDGRKNLIARLGEEAEDGIDALLSQTLGYERGNVPSLTGFLSWIDSTDIEIKRQMDTAESRIRVMTVHGSKGLEAPIVILPDTTKPQNRVRPDILKGPTVPLWKVKTKEMPPAIRQAADDYIEAQRREKRRLLYVAMTRAEKWLIVAAAGETGEGDDSWHSMVHDGMHAVGATELDGMLRYEVNDWNAGELRAEPAATPQKVDLVTFDPIEQNDKAERTLSPSDLGGAKSLFGEAEGDDQEIALARGRLVHQLLEHLPLHDADKRPALGETLIENNPDSAAIEDKFTLLADVLALLEKPELAELFSSSSLKEVEFTATLPELDGKRVHGAIDALIVDDTKVRIVDFKTNRNVPMQANETPEGILRQMGAYAAALREIYPSHEIETQILWTATAEIMSLPNELVISALKRVRFP